MVLEKYNECYESEHYKFYFKKNTLASNDIVKIALTQEDCFKKISTLLNIIPSFKIKYFLVETPEEVGQIYSEVYNDEDNSPCNGFAFYPDTIYCVYNDNVKCIGMHEDTHIISYVRLRPKSAFLREGLAMYMDKVWHGVANEQHVYNSLNLGNQFDFKKCLDNEYFFNLDCNISYPLAGSFVGFLIEKVGINIFLDELYYTQNDYIQQLNKISANLKNDMTTEFEEFIKFKAINLPNNEYNAEK